MNLAQVWFSIIERQAIHRQFVQLLASSTDEPEARDP